MPEERAGPSVVLLARSLVSESLWAAPEGSERMVFRVDRKVVVWLVKKRWEWLSFFGNVSIGAILSERIGRASRRYRLL